MNRYENGKIYKIVDVGYTKCYIGSTCEKLHKRFTRHKIDYRFFIKNNKTTDFTRSFLLFDEFGVENCKIELIENYPCNSKEELSAREGHHQKENDCVNKYIAGRSVKQFHEDNKEYLKEYWSKKHKEYHEKNPDKINETARKSYHKNKEFGNRLFQCDCGSTCYYRGRHEHFKTNKHQQYLQNQNNPQE